MGTSLNQLQVPNKRLWKWWPTGFPKPAAAGGGVGWLVGWSR